MFHDLALGMVAASFFAFSALKFLKQKRYSEQPDPKGKRHKKIKFNCNKNLIYN